MIVFPASVIIAHRRGEREAVAIRGKARWIQTEVPRIRSTRTEVMEEIDLNKIDALPIADDIHRQHGRFRFWPNPHR